MSELSRVVQQDVDAFTPREVPPFGTVRQRRARVVRRRVAGGALLSVAALAALLAVPSLLGAGQDRLPSYAAPSPVAEVESRRYELRFHGGAAYRPQEADVQACLSMPGASDVGVGYSDPPVYGATFTGREQMRAFERCVAELPGAYVAQTITRPAVDFPGLPGHPEDVTSVRICLSSNGNVCRTLSRHVDPELDRVAPLASAFVTARRLAPQEVDCRSLSEAYTVTFEHPSVPAAQILLPFGCGPVEVDGQYYDVSDEAAQGVREAYATPPWAGVTDLVTQCVGHDRPQPLAEYVGRTEAQARQTAARQGLRVLVLGAGSGCQEDQSRPYGENRVILVVADGAVLWAGRG
jgi:hypothetical protein